MGIITSIFVDDDPHDNISMGKVCIRTTIQSKITETCKVEIHGKSHSVRVKEFVGWVPDIETMDTQSDKNSETDNSDNNDEGPKDNDVQDTEDGEIRDTNEFQEEGVTDSIHSWADGTENIEKEHDDIPNENHNMEHHLQFQQKETEALKVDSESISKPSGFKGYK
ncbi:hypothetical protein Tco_0252149, partial [Tanacetum coccineum]